MHVVTAQSRGEDGVRRQSRAERLRNRSSCAKWWNKHKCQPSGCRANHPAVSQRGLRSERNPHPAYPLTPGVTTRCRVKRWRVRINPCPASLARVSTLTISRFPGIIWVPPKDSNDQIRWQDDWRWVRVTRPVNQRGKNRMLATPHCARKKTTAFLGSGGRVFPRPPDSAASWLDRFQCPASHAWGTICWRWAGTSPCLAFLFGERHVS